MPVLEFHGMFVPIHRLYLLGDFFHAKSILEKAQGEGLAAHVRVFAFSSD